MESESVLVDAMSAKFVLRPEELSAWWPPTSTPTSSPIWVRRWPAAWVWPRAPTSTRNAASQHVRAGPRIGPDIAGEGISNPVGAIASAALMLDHFGLHAEARRVEAAIETATGSGVLTRDIGGTSNTDEVTDAIIAALSKASHRPDLIHP